jgi:hypothetical protein
MIFGQDSTEFGPGPSVALSVVSSMSPLDTLYVTLYDCLLHG